MITTQEKTRSFGGFFEKVREYLVERTAIFGLIRWEEVVHTEKVDNDLILRIMTTKMPDKIFINSKEYRLSEVVTDENNGNNNLR